MQRFSRRRCRRSSCAFTPPALNTAGCLCLLSRLMEHPRCRAASIFHKEANTKTWDGIAWTLWTRCAPLPGAVARELRRRPCRTDHRLTSIACGACSENWTIPLVAVALYLLMLLLLIPFMKDRCALLPCLVAAALANPALLAGWVQETN